MLIIILLVLLLKERRLRARSAPPRDHDSLGCLKPKLPLTGGFS
jgi:hypothetical protein